MAGGCGLVVDLDPPDAVRFDASTADASLDQDAGAAADAAADAARADAAGADASADASLPSRCDELYPSALFCDDFEERPAFARWDRTRGMVSATTARVQRGSGAAHVVVVADQSSASLDVVSLPGTRSGELFVRAYFWVPRDAPAEGLTLLHVEEQGEPWGYAEIGLVDGALQLRAATGATAPRSAEFTGGAMPRERWVCLEMRMLVAEPDGELDLFVDDSPSGHFEGVDTLTAQPYVTLYAGIPRIVIGVQTFPSELYIDEVVVSRSRIGCASP